MTTDAIGEAQSPTLGSVSAAQARVREATHGGERFPREAGPELRVEKAVPAAQRLGPHHFAHLRAVAQGIPVVESARRYLGVEHAAAAAGAHRLAVEHVRAIARRRGDSRWRLLGLDLSGAGESVAATSASAAVPTLQEWADAKGLDGWSEDELQEMYLAEVDPDAATGAPPGARRRAQRLERLRRRRLELLDELARIAAERPAATDLLEGWLPPVLAERLRLCGTLTLGDLQARIARGGRWWSPLRGFGPVKAQRLAALVEVLLPSTPTGAWPVALARAELSRLSGRDGANRVREPGAAGIDAQDDLEAMRAWIAARAGSPHTAAQYQREAERFMLWCVLERHKALSDVTAEDCRAYMDFLGDVPERWISRRRAPRMSAGWAPFKGPLRLDSQRVAVDVLSSLFSWLVRARYLQSDPWVLVNRRLGDDPRAPDPRDGASRAFTREAWAALWAELDRSEPCPSSARLRWIITFAQSTGLRAAELIRAQRQHLVQEAEGWLLGVHGKGRRNRYVPVPSAAMRATRVYFAERGLDFDSAPVDTPLLGRLDEPMGAVGYRALLETLKRFIKRGIRNSDLSPTEQERTARATVHWLRHTYATRAAEGEMPLDVLQEILGQADPRTTSIYYRAQRLRRQREAERIFGALP
jgi:integrase